MESSTKNSLKPGSSLLESLPPEARNHIIEFLPAKDALVVSLVSSLWHEHVRHCGALWAGTLQRRYPISAERLQAELAAEKALRGGYLVYGEGVDYVQALSRLTKEHYGQITSHTCAPVPPKSRGCFSVFTSLFKKEDLHRILLLGLDRAGKTGLYNYIVDGLDGAVRETVPTIGFNVSTASHQDLKFICWDIGGQLRLRDLWKHYYNDTKAIVYVIDSASEDRLSEAGEVLAKYILCTLKDMPILFMATKQDLVGTLSVEQVACEVKTRLADDDRKWCVQGCSAKNGKGVAEGLEWLKSVLA